MEMLKELWAFMRTRKKYWLWPIFAMMALLGVLIVLAQGSAVAPFIYTLFLAARHAHPRHIRPLPRQRRGTRRGRRHRRRSPGGAFLAQEARRPLPAERGA